MPIDDILLLLWFYETNQTVIIPYSGESDTYLRVSMGTNQSKEIKLVMSDWSRRLKLSLDSRFFMF